jgi:hypothetical protein
VPTDHLELYQKTLNCLLDYRWYALQTSNLYTNRWHSLPEVIAKRVKVNRYQQAQIFMILLARKWFVGNAHPTGTTLEHLTDFHHPIFTKTFNRSLGT